MGIEEYAVGERIGAGAQGVVHRAVHTPTGHEVAIKIIDVSLLSEKERQGALNEVNILSLFASEVQSSDETSSTADPIPILGYIDSFVKDAQLHLVTEWCGYGSLQEHVDRIKKGGQKLSDQEVWFYFLSIVKALYYLHKRNILHRDVKLANVFIGQRTASGNPRVVLGDFGVSRLLNESSLARTLVGTPYYLSPEVCMGKEYGPKSDLWSAGVALYLLSHMRMPFEASNYAALILRICNETAQPKADKDVSQPLRQLLTWCLQREERNRPTALDVLSLPTCVAVAKELGMELPVEALSKASAGGGQRERGPKGGPRKDVGRVAQAPPKAPAARKPQQQPSSATVSPGVMDHAHVDGSPTASYPRAPSRGTIRSRRVRPGAQHLQAEIGTIQKPRRAPPPPPPTAPTHNFRARAATPTRQQGSGTVRPASQRRVPQSEVRAVERLPDFGSDSSGDDNGRSNEQLGVHGNVEHWQEAPTHLSLAERASSDGSRSVAPTLVPSATEVDNRVTREVGMGAGHPSNDDPFRRSITVQDVANGGGEETIRSVSTHIEAEEESVAAVTWRVGDASGQVTAVLDAPELDKCAEACSETGEHYAEEGWEDEDEPVEEEGNLEEDDDDDDGISTQGSELLRQTYTDRISKLFDDGEELVGAAVFAELVDALQQQPPLTSDGLQQFVEQRVSPPQRIPIVMHIAFRLVFLQMERRRHEALAASTSTPTKQQPQVHAESWATGSGLSVGGAGSGVELVVAEHLQCSLPVDDGQ